MSDSIVEQTAGRLSTITFLDLSYCGKIGAPALEAIGKHCKLLVTLCRNMHPNAAGKLSQDDEANIILLQCQGSSVLRWLIILSNLDG